MTATQAEFTATDAGLLVASQEPSVTVGPSALDRLLARGRIRGALAMLGPAFVASVAYVDPGNFATNIQGGAQYGYLLLWVVLAANLMAMVVQYLSAKPGIVAGRALPELVRDRLPRPATWGMWVQGEVVAMATDVAEFIGAALGLNLLFGVPMLPAGLITGLITFAVLGLRARGRRRFELAIIALLGLIVTGFLYETLGIGPSVPGSLHGLMPGLDGAGSLYLAAGILGATVMPHVIYLHSALTKDRAPSRDDRDRRRMIRFQQLNVLTALGLAGLVNMAMLAVAARAFHTPALAGLERGPAVHGGAGWRQTACSRAQMSPSQPRSCTRAGARGSPGWLCPGGRSSARRRSDRTRNAGCGMRRRCWSGCAVWRGWRSWPGRRVIRGRWCWRTPAAPAWPGRRSRWRPMSWPGWRRGWAGRSRRCTAEG
jgi:hypothetical protein